MRVLSLDQSVTGTGVAIYTKDSSLILDCYQPPPLDRDMLRYELIEDYINNQISKHKITQGVMEDYAYGAAYRAQQSGELGYLIKRIFHTKDIPLFIMPIGTHKKFTTGKGNTKKELMLKEVLKAYEVDTDNNNVADAVSILYTFLAYEKVSTGGSVEGLKLKQREAILDLIKERDRGKN